MPYHKHWNSKQKSLPAEETKTYCSDSLINECFRTVKISNCKIFIQPLGATFRITDFVHFTQIENKIFGSQHYGNIFAIRVTLGLRWQKGEEYACLTVNFQTFAWDIAYTENGKERHFWPRAHIFYKMDGWQFRLLQTLSCWSWAAHYIL